MRIEFPHSDRESFLWTGNRLRIGSGDQNDLRLPLEAAADHHAEIRYEPAIGLILEVAAGADRVYVNARPVRERALLRYGDLLGVGRSRMLLCADSVESSPDSALTHSADGVVGVRAVAGPLSGKIWSLQQQLCFGANGIQLPMPAGESAGFRFTRSAHGIELSAEIPCERFPLRLNGMLVTQPCRISAGDQIGLGMHRWVLEAPGLLADRPEPAASVPPIAAPLEVSTGPRGEIWWLLLTAAILALGIALVLWIHR